MSTQAEERRLLDKGMILFDPDYHGHPQVWTVSRVNKRTAVVIAHHDTLNIEATLTTNRVPKSMALVEHDALADLLRRKFEDVAPTVSTGDSA